MRIQAQARGHTFEFDADAGERVLHAGLRSGFELPYECATGTCGKCKATLCEGRLQDLWPEAPGKKTFEPGRTDFLMCQCSALGDLSIEIPRPVSARTRGAVAGRLRGTLESARTLAPGVIAFGLALETECSFEAGQFMLVGAPGLPGFRAYSMCNHASSVRRLEFLVKRKPGGGFSEWLFASARDGDRLELFGPLGKATFNPSIPRNIVCIAGGSGIAGMMSILACADAARHFEAREGRVFFGVRTFADAFFLDELSALALRWAGRLVVTVAFSDEAVPASATAEWPALEFAHGLVHDVVRQTMAGPYANVRAYVAGPPPAVDAALRVLLVHGRVPPTDICYDKFS